MTSVSNGGDFAHAVDDAYRALGRYIYEFSRLLWWIKFGIESTLMKTNNPDAPWIGQLLLREAGAQQVATAFFGVMGIHEHDGHEEAVAKKLRTQVNEVIQTRNDIAHGDWFIGWGREGELLPEPPSLLRIRPTRREGPLDHRNYEPAKIDHLSDEIASLRRLVGEYATLLTLPPGTGFGRRVSDVLRVEAGKVTRSGPVAAKMVPGGFE